MAAQSLPITALVSIAALLASASPALAQDVHFFDDNGDGEADVLIPQSEWPEWAARGTGSPTVVFDEVAEEWVMLFEVRLSEAYVDSLGGDYESCQPRVDRPPVVWAIGRATSPDGLTGWSIDPEPVVLPAVDTWRPCSTAHPWVVVSEGTWHLYYKAEQGFEPCPPDSDPPPWGCGRMTGVGYATSTDGGQTWDLVDDGLPMLEIGSFGFPTVVAFQEPGAALEDTTWTMLLTRDDGLYLAQSDDPGVGWELDEANPVLAPGTWSFAQDAWFQPSLTCAAQGETFPYSAWIGGDNLTGGSGFDRLNSLDGVEWLGDGRPIVAWDGEPLWRHWDVVRVGDEAYVYYTTRGDDNAISVRLMKVGDDPTFDLDPALWSGRACLYGERPDPDPEPDPTDGTDDTDPPGDDPEDDPGCYCSSSATPLPALPLLGALGLVGLLRRRRRS